MFGELIGLWCVTVWQSLGQPPLLRLIELGPGRGTLMRDALRAARAVPAFLDAVRVHLIEISEPLRELQRITLDGYPTSSPRRRGSMQPSAANRPGDVDSRLRGNDAKPTGPLSIAWHEALDEVPEGPAIVIGNEFLDALPIRQLVRAEDGWRERVVDVAPDGGLRFAVGDRAEAPELAGMPPPAGTIVELRPGENELLASLGALKDPVAALFIDYGPAEQATGDTLQAVRRHAYVDPLAEPGEADLTAHVQFARLARKARAAGLDADGPITQAQFLGALGIAERAARLMAANPDLAGSIEAAVQRLMSPTGMGQLFKAMLVRSRSLPPQFPFV